MDPQYSKYTALILYLLIRLGRISAVYALHVCVGKVDWSIVRSVDRVGAFMRWAPFQDVVNPRLRPPAAAPPHQGGVWG